MTGQGTVEALAVSILKGMAINKLLGGLCTTALGQILNPLLKGFGIVGQAQQIQDAIKSGDKVELALAITQTICLAFGLTQQCFTGETKVATTEGAKAIKDIKSGDYVYSYNTETGKTEPKQVTAVYVSEKNELYHVHTTSGDTINTTEGHPFYVKGKGFVTASELKEGDTLTTADGKEVKVNKVTISKLETPVKVYNLEVEDNHTYYVSEDEVLVHNM